MKKLFLPATLVAMMGVGAYFGHATAAPSEGLSDLELANAEALADNPEQGWDTSCEHKNGYWCVLGPYSVIRDAIGNADPDYPVN